MLTCQIPQRLFENAQQVSGEVNINWDHRDVMDASTAHILSYAGVRCRVVERFLSVISVRQASRGMHCHLVAISVTIIQTAD